MSNELQVINEQVVLEKFFKIYGTVDNPLFLAKDVADWIEHTQVSKMLQSIDEDEKLMGTLFLSGQKRETWFLTEDGVYEVLMLSRKPIAKEFKKKIKEIIKEIRNTGSFDVVGNSIMKIEDEKERLLRFKINGQENILTIDPSDMMANALLTNYKLELSQYLSDKKLNAITNKVEEIEYKVNRSVIVREGDKTGEAVARTFSIFSTSNKPHGNFAEHMAKKLGFYISPDGNIGYQDEYVTVNIVQRGGTEVPALKFSKEAVRLMSECIENEGLEIAEVEYGKRGMDKGKFKRAKIAFDTGNIWVNETTYNLYN